LEVEIAIEFDLETAQTIYILNNKYFIETW